MIPTGTITLSLNKQLARKAEIMRGKLYPKMSVDDAVKQFTYDKLDELVPDKELPKEKKG